MTLGIDERTGLIDAYAVRGYGTTIGVRVDDRSIVPTLLERLPPSLTVVAARAVDTAIPVFAGRALAAGKQSDEVLCDLLENFDSQLRFAVASYSRANVFIHAGVVAWKGKAAIFPGRSHAGKTHLTAALIAAGADYVSDEHAILDRDGMLHPWPKSLSVRDGVTKRQRDVPPSEFGARVAEAPMPVALILAARFVPLAHWNPLPLSSTEGALELMNNAVAARRYPDAVMHAVSAVGAKARAFKTDRPDAARVVPQILEMLEEGARDARFWGRK